MLNLKRKGRKPFLMKYLKTQGGVTYKASCLMSHEIKCMIRSYQNTRPIRLSVRFKLKWIWSSCQKKYSNSGAELKRKSQLLIMMPLPSQRKKILLLILQHKARHPACCQTWVRVSWACLEVPIGFHFMLKALPDGRNTTRCQQKWSRWRKNQTRSENLYL